MGIDITIDTREKLVLEFSRPYIDSISSKKLDYGDYSATYKGKVCPTFFERKSIADLFGTLGRGHKNFIREINRCFNNDHRIIIVIEKPLETIWKGYPRSMLSGKQIARTLFTLLIKYDINFVCCKSRAEMALYISEYYYSWMKQEDKLAKKM